ncbi:MAG TPA: hypothetical protein VFP84_27295 [Kofleriaceae bacterium]|nr:hypothetical protein [Kofleriaceae bacterium]
MTRFASTFAGCLVACALVACGGSDPPSVEPPGSGPPLACDPVEQTGCTAAGQKCTWIVDIDATADAPEVGHVGCVQAGAIAVGGACDDAVVGHDDGCVAGALCIAGACKPICDPQLVEGAAPGACAQGDACSTYTGVFESAGAPIAGVCEPGCDPLSQRRTVDHAEACGSPDPAAPSATCIASDGFRTFHCAPTTPELAANTDRVPPLAPDGEPFINGCAAGFIPFFYEDASGAMNTLCTGLCAPLKVDATLAADPAHKLDHAGDPSALGKLPADPAPVAGHATCAVGIKGSEPAEDCRFLWFPLAHGDPTKALTTPYNDTLGVCFAYQKFLTVTIPGTSQKAAEKSCAELPVTAPLSDPYGSARDNGCYPLSDSLGPSAGRVLSPPLGTVDPARPAWLGRLGGGVHPSDDVPLVRHAMD